MKNKDIVKSPDWTTGKWWIIKSHMNDVKKTHYLTKSYKEYNGHQNFK